MRTLPSPSPAEVMEALSLALTSPDQTVRELLRTLVLITRAVHPPRGEVGSYWDTLPDFGS